MVELIEEILEAIFEEGFVLPIIIVGSIIASISKRKKKAAAAHAASYHNPQPEKPAPQQQAKPATPTIMPTLSFGDVPGQVIAPTVHPHVEPDCDTHDMPGSLGETSEEGKDPCHDEQLIHPRQAVEVPAEETAQPFQWSGSNMMKAVIMQEVLNRPCQRRARR
ncbi:MAG: hypothetical protein PUC00_05360 [Clostridiales bacterium]|nr:hypothetical protein [Clostridiales bacterium]